MISKTGHSFSSTLLNINITGNWSGFVGNSQARSQRIKFPRISIGKKRHQKIQDSFELRP
jgi:hypothetical protein